MKGASFFPLHTRKSKFRQKTGPDAELQHSPTQPQCCCDLDCHFRQHQAGLAHADLERNDDFASEVSAFCPLIGVDNVIEGKALVYRDHESPFVHEAEEEPQVLIRCGGGDCSESWGCAEGC